MPIEFPTKVPCPPPSGFPCRPAACLLTIAVGFGWAQAPLPEHPTKARMILLLADYITWPPRTGIAERGRPLVVGVLGESPIAPFLFSSPVPVKGSLPTRTQLKGVSGVEACDVVFIAESESARLLEVLRAVRGRPILTVADTPGFCNRGVMVNFIVQQGTIFMEVNLTATRQAGLEIGSPVLRRARIID